MKFLLDAQLPPSLKRVFLDNGYDCIHTMDLQTGNETPDKIVNSLSIAENRVVITKDRDFYDSFLVYKEPYKLILVQLGNVSKKELIAFFKDAFEDIIEKIKSEDLVLLRKYE